MKLKLYRCGSKEDGNLCKGSYWSNYITLCKPYYKGKIAVIEVDLKDSEQGRYMLSKEIRAYGDSKSWGKWTRVISNYGEEYDRNYYYISPNYLQEHSTVLAEYVGEESYIKLCELIKKERELV